MPLEVCQVDADEAAMYTLRWVILGEDATNEPPETPRRRRVSATRTAVSGALVVMRTWVHRCCTSHCPVSISAYVPLENSGLEW